MYIYDHDHAISGLKSQLKRTFCPRLTWRGGLSTTIPSWDIFSLIISLWKDPFCTSLQIYLIKLNPRLCYIIITSYNSPVNLSSYTGIFRHWVPASQKTKCFRFLRSSKWDPPAACVLFLASVQLVQKPSQFFCQTIIFVCQTITIPVFFAKQ